MDNQNNIARDDEGEKGAPAAGHQGEDKNNNIVGNTEGQDAGHQGEAPPSVPKSTARSTLGNFMRKNAMPTVWGVGAIAGAVAVATVFPPAAPVVLGAYGGYLALRGINNLRKPEGPNNPGKPRIGGAVGAAVIGVGAVATLALGPIVPIVMATSYFGASAWRSYKYLNSPSSGSNPPSNKQVKQNAKEQEELAKQRNTEENNKTIAEARAREAEAKAKEALFQSMSPVERQEYADKQLKNEEQKELNRAKELAIQEQKLEQKQNSPGWSRGRGIFTPPFTRTRNVNNTPGTGGITPGN